MQEPLLKTFVLSLRRDQRGTVPADWKERVRSLPGVLAGPSASPARMQVEATAEGVSKLREELGHLLLIEAVLSRGLLDS